MTTLLAAAILWLATASLFGDSGIAQLVALQRQYQSERLRWELREADAEEAAPDVPPALAGEWS